jgi:hypothetical protein
MHVAHCRRQVGMTGKLLDGLRRRTAHRQIRAERVAKDCRSSRSNRPCSP